MDLDFSSMFASAFEMSGDGVSMNHGGGGDGQSREDVKASQLLATEKWLDGQLLEFNSAIESGETC